jgi:phosphorylcholine metabolism protein LicD
MNLIKAGDAISIIDFILTENNVDYFVNFGTLLGLIREGHVIKHDTDIDIAIINCHRKTIDSLIISFEKLNFKFTYELREFEFFSFLFYSIKIDFTHYKHLKKFLVHDSLKLKTADVYPIKIIEFSHFKSNVPNKHKKILRSYYGPNWQIPNRGFHYDSKRTFLFKMLYKYTFPSIQQYLRSLKK